jgi:hypothetical protein
MTTSPNKDWLDEILKGAAATYMDDDSFQIFGEPKSITFRQARAAIQQHIVEVLKDIRCKSDWGDGSPNYLDQKIKQYDPTYDVRLEIDRRDAELQAGQEGEYEH